MNLLFLTCLFPLLGWFLLAFSRGRFSENLSALIGVGSVGAAGTGRSASCRRSRLSGSP